jgi:hypothetical protein
MAKVALKTVPRSLMYLHLAIPFSLRIPPEKNSDILTTTSRQYNMRGIARLEEGTLHLEWTGRVRVVKESWMSSSEYEEAGPKGETRVPLAQLHTVQLCGRWWRPRLELSSLQLTTFEEVPSALGNSLTLYLQRQDWAPAKEFCIHLNLGLAEAAVEAAEALPNLRRLKHED